MLSRAWLALVSAITIAGCVDDSPTAPFTDARPDPGPPRAPAELRAAARPCDERGVDQLPRTRPGQRSTLSLRLDNVGDVDALVEVIAIEGPDAADLEILPHDSFDGSHCLHVPIHQHEHVIGAGSYCHLEVAFHPTTAGFKRPVLHLTGTAFDQRLELGGTSTAPPPPPYLVPSTPDLYFDEPGSATVRIENVGTDAVVLGEPVTPPDFTATTTCPPTMTPGAACTMTITYQPLPRTFGCLRDHVSLSGLATDLDVEVRAIGRTPLLGVAITGPGRVTSSPAGIDCGPWQTCTGAFAGAPPVTLTAASGGRFTGWNQRHVWHHGGRGGTSLNDCGLSPTCTVPSDEYFAEAMFTSLSGKRIDVTIAGDGSVRAGWGSNGDDKAVTCDASCRLWVEPGTAVTLTASGAFTGWAGDCTGSDPACNLGLVIADRAVTATF